MNITLLIFFALPIATIIVSIALQKILKCPPLVSAIIFAIFLIVTFIINNLNFLIATIVYTIISFITAVLVCIICKLIRHLRLGRSSCRCNNSNELLSINSNCGNLEDGNLLTISSCYSNGTNNDLLTISSNNTSGNNSDCDYGCGCNCNQDNDTDVNNEVTARINVIPNTNNNGRTGNVCGCYRRR